MGGALVCSFFSIQYLLIHPDECSLMESTEMEPMAIEA